MVRRRARIDKSVLAFSEPSRLRSEPHRRFIASLGCCMCPAQPPTQAAHIRFNQTGGTGLKPCDSLTVPLCPSCHSRQHATSELAVYGDVDRVKRLAKDLFEVSGDGLKALVLISKFKSGL